MTKPRLKVGLVGSGFMGKTHVFGYATAASVFDLPFKLELELVADATAGLAESARRQFGFRRATGDWKELVEDPEVDLVDVTAPNSLHKEIALASLANGKHVYCEKPLATTSEDARMMAEAALLVPQRTQVGFNYLANPMFGVARMLISEGRLGTIHSFRGIHAEDYMLDRTAPWSWRLDCPGGGAFADLGSHVLATAEFLIGPIVRVLGDLKTVYPRRPDRNGIQRTVGVDDIGRALVEFGCGATGSIEANWVATGRKMQHDFEIYGSEGALLFTQDRFNELHYYANDGNPGMRGFRRIVAGTDHEPYGRFCVASGHQLGYNDLKAIEIKGFIDAIAGLQPEPYSFAAGYRIQRLVDQIRMSSAERSWRKID